MTTLATPSQLYVSPTVPLHSVAARAVDASKIYGKGEAEVRALDHVSVAFEDSELRTRTYDRRGWPPGYRIRSECIFFVRVSVRSTREKLPRASEQSGHYKRKEHVSFHC